MPGLLACLPSELYINIILQVPLDDRPQAVLALSRAIPRSPVPIQFLYENIRLKDKDAVFQLYRCLRKNPGYIAWIRHFSLESWTVDADVTVNLLGLIPHLTTLKLFIGPNFAPEHLEELFERPIEGLAFISLRFRPYVQRATYYQFLKGAYFDSTLTAFLKWPASYLPTLSITQDPLDPSIAPTRFAQPLVFFRLDPLSTLAQAPLLVQLRHFRLRIPARQPTRFLYGLPRALPQLELLDMSTCNVLDSDVEGVLGQFAHLYALVLDNCPVVSQRHELEGEPLAQWAALGKTMALAGAKRAMEREKRLKAWREAHEAAMEEAALQAKDEQQQPQEQPGPSGKRPRRGRRGLATATISIRPSPPRESKPKVRVKGKAKPPPPMEKIRIVPSLPKIFSLTTTTPPSIGSDRHAAIRAEFERGWAEGIAQLTAVRRRYKSSWKNGVRMVRFKSDIESGTDDEDGSNGLAGLEDVEGESAFDIAPGANDAGGSNQVVAAYFGRCPILCLAGPGRNENHVEDCGHQLGWRVWGDEL